MRFDYTDSGVAQGRANQDMAKENPNTFATDSGADRVNQVTSLDKPKQRMAGQMGHRIMEYLQNPEEKERTDSWMAMFELSNEGKQFNQAKMGGAGGGMQ
jgi:hypothetical protein